MLVTLLGIVTLVKLLLGERILSDAGDVGADDNARDVGGVIERLVPMRVTGRPLIKLGMFHRTTGTDVSADGNSAVVRSVSELCLHCGRQHQEEEPHP